MSILGELDRNKYSNLDTILIRIDKQLANWKSDLNIDGKNIEKANIEQPSRLAYYDEIRVQVKSLKNYMEMRVREMRGKALKRILDNSAIDLNERSRDKLIESDPDLIRLYELQIEIEETHEMVESIVKQFRDRAFILNNLVKIRVAGIEDITLYLDD